MASWHGFVREGSVVILGGPGGVDAEPVVWVVTENVLVESLTEW